MDKTNSRYEHIVHPFPPLYDDNSRILILGSLPSVKSREQMFFYGHKQNRFWKVMANVLHNTMEDMQNEYAHITDENAISDSNNMSDIYVPATIEEKKKMLHRHHIALWDAIYSCDIIGSSDSSIKNVVPTDLKPILEHSQVKKVFCNGATSAKYYKKYQEKEFGIEAETLPSTSPANAAYSVDRLVEIWSDRLGAYL